MKSPKLKNKVSEINHNDTDQSMKKKVTSRKVEWFGLHHLEDVQSKSRESGQATQKSHHPEKLKVIC